MNSRKLSLILTVCFLLLGAWIWAVGEETAATLQEQVISVFEAAAPAVVHITARGTVEDPFMMPVPTEGTGSGFLYDDRGHIVTNYHVVADADLVTVAFWGGGVLRGGDRRIGSIDRSGGAARRAE